MLLDDEEVAMEWNAQQEDIREHELETDEGEMDVDEIEDN
jgi:hypothetical protein